MLDKISKEQSEFYTYYLRQKQVIFSRLEQEVTDKVRLNSEVISCREGCAYCCFVYVEATLKECMAIVYYLSRNEKLLLSFLKKYREWHRKTEQLADRCITALCQARKQNQSKTALRDLVDLLLFYKLQNIACPFLDKGACSIYPARPFTCASHFASSPSQWCNPRDIRNPKIYKGSFAGEIADLSLYNEKLKDPGLTLMPVKVFEILQADYYFTT
jgi:Fe-S-cluster containining protein